MEWTQALNHCQRVSLASQTFKWFLVIPRTADYFGNLLLTAHSIPCFTNRVVQRFSNNSFLHFTDPVISCFTDLVMPISRMRRHFSWFQFRPSPNSRHGFRLICLLGSACFLAFTSLGRFLRRGISRFHSVNFCRTESRDFGKLAMLTIFTRFQPTKWGSLQSVPCPHPQNIVNMNH